MPSESYDSGDRDASRRGPDQRILLVTGLLGAGKTTALRVL
jgi:type II secretory pathway predicted ATPase ExeA